MIKIVVWRHHGRWASWWKCSPGTVMQSKPTGCSWVAQMEKPVSLLRKCSPLELECHQRVAKLEEVTL